MIESPGIQVLDLRKKCSKINIPTVNLDVKVTIFLNVKLLENGTR